jgi:hypothetical protein
MNLDEIIKKMSSLQKKSLGSQKLNEALIKALPGGRNGMAQRKIFSDPSIRISLMNALELNPGKYRRLPVEEIIHQSIASDIQEISSSLPTHNEALKSAQKQIRDQQGKIEEITKSADSYKIQFQQTKDLLLSKDFLIGSLQLSIIDANQKIKDLNDQVVVIKKEKKNG